MAINHTKYPNRHHWSFRGFSALCTRYPALQSIAGLTCFREADEAAVP